jgi:imidazolonepropionase-like amidohydrolase
MENRKLKAVRIFALGALSKGGNMRRGFIAGLLFSMMTIFVAQAALAAEKPGAAPYEIVITNGKIIDGTSNPWFHADVAIKNGKIVKIGRVAAKNAKRVIDAKGMAVAPGFIDMHTHTDLTALADGNPES